MNNKCLIYLQRRFISRLGLMILAVPMLTACGTQGQATTPQPTELPVPTIPPSELVSTPTATWFSTIDATRHAVETVSEQDRADLFTRYALSPTPPFPTLGPPQPTETWIMGLHECSEGSGYYPQVYGCWRGIVNGELISIAGGRQGSGGDTTQGLLMVFHGPLFDPLAPTTEYYSTPVRLGGVRLVSVDGSRLTLVPYNPWYPQATYPPDTTFVFDLDTRQWVSSPPSPTITITPSLSPIPSPSLSPIPTTLPLPSPSP